MRTRQRRTQCPLPHAEARFSLIQSSVPRNNYFHLCVPTSPRTRDGNKRPDSVTLQSDPGRRHRGRSLLAPPRLASRDHSLNVRCAYPANHMHRISDDDIKEPCWVDFLNWSGTTGKESPSLSVNVALTSHDQDSSLSFADRRSTRPKRWCLIDSEIMNPGLPIVRVDLPNDFMSSHSTRNPSPTCPYDITASVS